MENTEKGDFSEMKLQVLDLWMPTWLQENTGKIHLATWLSGLRVKPPMCDATCEAGWSLGLLQAMTPNCFGDNKDLLDSKAWESGGEKV